MLYFFSFFFFFFNDTATTEIYTLSLHDALPICKRRLPGLVLRERRHFHEQAIHHAMKPFVCTCTHPLNFDFVETRSQLLLLSERQEPLGHDEKGGFFFYDIVVWDPPLPSRPPRL